MRKINLLLIALMAFAMTTQAEVLLVENFEYENSLSLTTANPDWFLHWGGESNMLIVDPALEFPGYPGSNVGSALLISGDDSNDMPQHKFTQQTEGDVFVAFLLEPTLVTKSGYFLTLRDDNSSAYNYCGRVYAGIDEDYNSIIGLSFFKQNIAAAEYSEQILEDDKTYLVVMQYSIVSGSNNDKVSLYLFDEMPKKMLSTPLIGPIANPNKQSSPDINPARITFRSYDDNGFLTIDGLRVATTFWEALGVDEPMDVSSQKSDVRSHRLVLRDGHIVVTDGESEYSLLGQKK